MNKNIIKELKDAVEFVGYKRFSLITEEEFKRDTRLKHLVKNQCKLSEEFRKEFNIEVDTTKNILYFNNYQKLVEVLKDRNYYIDSEGYAYGYMNSFYPIPKRMELNKEYNYNTFDLFEIMISSQPVDKKTEAMEFKKVKFHISKIIQKIPYDGFPNKMRFIASSFTFI